MEMPFKNDPRFIQVAKKFNYVVAYLLGDQMEFEGFENQVNIWKRIDEIVGQGRYCLVIATFVGDGCKLAAYIDGNLLHR